MNLFRVIRKFFYEFDIFNAQANLRMNDEPEMKSCPIGFLSFLFILLFTYWFISICVDLFNYNEITSTSQHTLTPRRNQPNGTFQTFAVTLDYLPFQLFESMFMFETTIFSNGSQIKIPMVPCKNTQWKLLGNNYNQIFKQLLINQMYCPDTTQNFNIQGLLYASNQAYVFLSLKFCEQNQNTSCSVSRGIQWIKYQTENQITSSQFQIVILDKTVYPSREQPVGYLPNTDALLQITSEISSFAFIQFSFFNVETDYSFLPTVDIQNQIGIRVDNVKKGSLAITNTSGGLIACAFFMMNSKAEKITRSVGKLDNVLSYTGGLLSILMAFTGFFLMSFNEYRYQLRIAESTFHSPNPATKVNIKQNDMHIWMYIKYTVFDWINLLCCCSLKWKQCEEINQVLDQIKSQMELQRIFKRLQNIDRGLDRLIGEDTRTCMSLMKLPTREQLKLKRLINDYYDEIIKIKDEIIQQKNNTRNKIKSQILYKQNQNSISSIHNQGISINLQQIINQSQDTKQVNSSRPLNLQQFSTEQIQKMTTLPLSQDLQQAEDKIVKAFGKLDQQERQYFGGMIPPEIYYRLQKKLENN